MTKISISTPFIRLCDLMKLSGIVQTGGEAKQLILSGEVLLNHEPCFMKGKKVIPNDIVTFQGKDILVMQDEN